MEYFAVLIQNLPYIIGISMVMLGISLLSLKKEKEKGADHSLRWIIGGLVMLALVCLRDTLFA